MKILGNHVAIICRGADSEEISLVIDWGAVMGQVPGLQAGMLMLRRPIAERKQCQADDDGQGGGQQGASLSWANPLELAGPQ